MSQRNFRQHRNSDNTAKRAEASMQQATAQKNVSELLNKAFFLVAFLGAVMGSWLLFDIEVARWVFGLGGALIVGLLVYTMGSNSSVRIVEKTLEAEGSHHAAQSEQQRETYKTLGEMYKAIKEDSRNARQEFKVYVDELRSTQQPAGLLESEQLQQWYDDDDAIDVERDDQWSV